MKRSNTSKDDAIADTKDSDSMLQQKAEVRVESKEEVTFCNELLSTLFILDVVRQS